LSDNEAEVKHAAINNIVPCLGNLSLEKIQNLLLPTLQSSYPDGTIQFRAGTAEALCNLAEVVGKDFTQTKIMSMLMDLIKDDNAEV